MSFGQAKFPWDARVLDAGLRGSARAAVVTADEHDIRMSLRYAGRNCANSHFGDELNAIWNHDLTDVELYCLFWDAPSSDDVIIPMLSVQ